MTRTSYETLEDLITIERTPWENNAETYHEGYSPEALLIFTAVLGTLGAVATSG